MSFQKTLYPHLLKSGGDLETKMEDLGPILAILLYLHLFKSGGDLEHFLEDLGPIFALLGVMVVTI